MHCYYCTIFVSLIFYTYRNNQKSEMYISCFINMDKASRPRSTFLVTGWDGETAIQGRTKKHRPLAFAAAADGPTSIRRINTDNPNTNLPNFNRIRPNSLVMIVS